MSFSTSIKLCCLFVFAVMLVACGKKQEEDTKIPDGILSEEKFTKLLTDFALAESAGNMNVKNIDYRKLDSVYAFNPLIENNISKTQYDSAISFYVNHPALYKKVYENVLMALSQMQAKRNSFNKRDSAKKDSISK